MEHKQATDSNGPGEQIADAEDDSSSVEGATGIVRLSYTDPRHQRPVRMLRIPHNTITKFSTKPRRWLCYAAYTLCYTEGSLALCNEHGELSDADLEGTVNEGDHLVYRMATNPNFVDPDARGSIRSSSRISARSTDSTAVVTEYYGGCPFTFMPDGYVECCHLIPHIRQADYLRALLRSRDDPIEDIEIDDPRNMLPLSATLHSTFDKKCVAFIRTPNPFLRSSDLPGRESVDPDKYLVTLHVFVNVFPQDQVPHGRSSDMTQYSGLQDPPADRHIDEGIVPRNVLFDIAYATSLVAQWGSGRFRRFLKEDSRRFNSEDPNRRGEDRERNLRREEASRSRNQHNKERDDITAGRAHNIPAGKRERLDEEFGWIYDALLWMPYECRGTSREEIELERGTNRRIAEQEEAEQHIKKWRKDIHGLDYEDEPKYLIPTPGSDDEKPVSVEEALGRISQDSFHPSPCSSTMSPASLSKTHDTDSDESIGTTS